jgi:hypothetical protein
MFGQRQAIYTPPSLISEVIGLDDSDSLVKLPVMQHSSSQSALSHDCCFHFVMAKEVVEQHHNL